MLNFGRVGFPSSNGHRSFSMGKRGIRNLRFLCRDLGYVDMLVPWGPWRVNFLQFFLPQIAGRLDFWMKVQPWTCSWVMYLLILHGGVEKVRFVSIRDGYFVKPWFHWNPKTIVWMVMLIQFQGTILLMVFNFQGFLLQFLIHQPNQSIFNMNQPGWFCLTSNRGRSWVGGWAPTVL